MTQDTRKHESPKNIIPMPKRDLYIRCIDDNHYKRLIRSQVRPFGGELALRLEETIKAKAKENQLSGLKQGDQYPVSSNLTEREAISTRKELSNPETAPMGHTIPHAVGNPEMSSPEDILMSTESSQPLTNLSKAGINHRKLIDFQASQLSEADKRFHCRVMVETLDKLAICYNTVNHITAEALYWLHEAHNWQCAETDTHHVPYYKELTIMFKTAIYRGGRAWLYRIFDLSISPVGMVDFIAWLDSRRSLNL